MIITALFIGLLVATFIFGRINLSVRFNKEVKHLFSSSKNISEKTFHYSELPGLPPPVQRYFKYILKEG